MNKTSTITAPPIAMGGGFAATPCQDVMTRILENATKTGDAAFKPTTMAIRMVEGALSQAG